MTGGPDPTLKKHKNIGFLSNTGPNPLGNHKAIKPAFNVGPSLACQRNTAFSGIWILSPSLTEKNKQRHLDPL